MVAFYYESMCIVISLNGLMMKKQIRISLFLLLTSGLAFGSGSGGGGKSAGPDYSKHSSNYIIGKQIFFSQLHCASCPLADLPLEKESIANIMPLLKSKGELGRLLSYRNRYAVKYFLKKRFEIN